METEDKLTRLRKRIEELEKGEGNIVQDLEEQRANIAGLRSDMQALEQAGFSLALPVIAGESLLFRRYRTGDSLVAGRFNTFEPAPDCETVTPACVLVPLVAFDGQCQRLGYGAGFYDRMLAGFGAARPLTLGLAYECQYLAELPVDGHDQPLDLVLTESDLRRRRGHETR
jgi:5-formyltetrahydrofolate cyclo-ligase